MDYAYFGSSSQPLQYVPVPGKQANSYTPQAEAQRDHLDTFNDPTSLQYFNQNATYAQPPLVVAAQPPPPPSHRNGSSQNMMYLEDSESMPRDVNPEGDFGEQALRGSSDEDKDNLTPAQSRRKAQNRTAQRAFRERKERHVKELEMKLKTIEAQSTDLLSDNERLRRELDRLATQNDILRATSTPTRIPGLRHQSIDDLDRSAENPDDLATGPMIYSTRTFNAAFAHSTGIATNEPISHRIAVSSTTGQRMLATGAAWDLIQSHELHRKGFVDLGEVVDRLREKAICDGTGPSFAENDILRAIEESAGVPGDELI